MSIAQQNNAQIERLRSAISDAYTACNEKDAILPSTQNMSGLAACIRSISAGSQYYATQINQSSNTQNISFDIGFEPRLFVIATVNSFTNSSTGTYYITSFWHCADLTGQGYGEYTGGLALRKDSASSAGQIISYDARNYYSYSNGIVTIKDTAHYFRANTLYRVFAMA